MSFTGYHHIGLYVRDAEKSLAFYRALGGEVTFSFPMGDTGKIIHMVDMGGGAVVEIVPSGTDDKEANARWAHIALETQDARAAYELALRAGAMEKSPPKDVMLGTMSACTAFVFGPEGECVEFFEVKA